MKMYSLGKRAICMSLNRSKCLFRVNCVVLQIFVLFIILGLTIYIFTRLFWWDFQARHSSKGTELDSYEELFVNGPWCRGLMGGEGMEGAFQTQLRVLKKEGIALHWRAGKRSWLATHLCVACLVCAWYLLPTKGGLLGGVRLQLELLGVV